MPFQLQRRSVLYGLLTFGALALNAILNVFLIPRFGLNGAAVATLVAYSAFALAGWVFNKRLLPAGRVIGALIGIGVWSISSGQRPPERTNARQHVS